MNNKIIAAAVLLVVAIMEGVTAFSTGPSSLATRRVASSTAPLGPSLEFQTTSSTALNLNVKDVKSDPNAPGKKGNANAKMATYGGSIVVAALLPIAFLIWSAVSK